MIVLLILLGSLYGLLHTIFIQTWLAKKVCAHYSKELKTKITIKKIEVAFFSKVKLSDLLILDKNNDSLLYAGNIDLDLNDWFFLKDTIIINNISLDNIAIHSTRENSNWNYQFISDYFLTSSDKKQKSANPINIKFDNIHLRNIILSNTDKWIGEDISFSLKEFNAKVKTFDLSNKNIIIDQAEIATPIFERKDYEGKRPTREKKKIQKMESPNDWKIFARSIILKNGVVKNDKETVRLPYKNKFDELHIFFHSINGNIENLNLEKDTLQANVNLSTKEKCGFSVLNLKSKFKFTPRKMEFDSLDLLTKTSHLKNYYSMNYTSFQDDMDDFINKVNLVGRLNDSKVSSEDISFFAPELKNWDRIFNITSEVNGTIEELHLNNAKLKNTNTSIEGSGILKHLTNINSFSIDFNSTGSKTNINDIIGAIPNLKSIKQPSIRKLGDIKFTGKFYCTNEKYTTEGTVETSLGNINTKLKLEFPAIGQPLYSGHILSKKFNIGSFLNENKLGDISIEGEINGSGFDLEKIKSNFTGQIQNLFFNEYNYKNIGINGDFKNKSFIGRLEIDDPNIKINELNGSISFIGNDINLNISSELSKCNFKKLHFTNRDISLSGLFNFNFIGNNIDDFLGEAKVYKSSLQDENKILYFDSLTLSSALEKNNKTLSLQSSDIDANITGVFKIKELTDAFKVFLSNYYPNYISKPTKKLSNQNFSFYIKTKNTEDLLKVLDPKIIGGNNSIINGRVDLYNKSINAYAEIPRIGYNNRVFSNVSMTEQGNLDSLLTNINFGNIILTENASIPNTSIYIKSSNDISDIKLTTSSSENINNAELNASLTTLTDGIKIHFYPSSFIINDKTWNLEKDGELTLRKNFIHANEIKFNQDNQSVLISTELDNTSEEQRIIAQINNFSLEDFIPFAFKDPSVKGFLTGTAIIKDPMGKMDIEFKGDVKNLYLDNKIIGNVAINSTANTSSGLINYFADNIDSQNVFSLKGTYNYKDSVNNLRANLDAHKINLSILQPYLSDIFNQMDGIATTNLKLSGGDDHQYLTGKAHIPAGSFTVDYTKCKYTLENQDIDFSDDFIDLNFIQIKDTLNNTATINGKIHHNLFNDISFNNLKVETGKLILLHTTKNDNPDFYGNIIGKSSLSINGPISNAVINIDGEPSLLDTSHIYIPTSDSKESIKTDYIEFVKFGKELDNTNISNGNNITINLKIKANPSCKVDVILDEETGDIIKGQGEGLIDIKVGSSEPLSIRGNYKLTKGEYNFNFQTFFQKPFTLNSGTITWNGDPYQANIDIYAEYLAKNVDISNLSTSSGFKQKEDIKIISHLTGILQNPLVKFDLELPEKSDAKREDIIVKRLADFKNDENEMNKQVASLLLFNTFIIGNQNFLTQGNASTLITNTIGGVVSSLLTNLLNKELEKATKGMLSTYVDINPTLDLQKSASQLQANIRAGLKILLSNKLVVLVGGNLDYNNPTYSQQLEKKGLLSPDITIEWLINKDGTLRIVGFNRSSIDLTLNQRNRSGLQLSYRKDINKLREIFTKSKK